MNITFGSIEIEHFRSISMKQELNLGLGGLWFIKGDNQVEPQLGGNGAGKSSLWAALCWVLYGKTANGLRNPDIKPWVGKGVPKVTLRCMVDDEEYDIQRVAKTNGLTINGKEVGPDDAAKLVGLSFEAFTNTLYLAQGSPLFFDRTPKEKLELFTEVLKLNRWEERSRRAAAKVKELTALDHEMSGELVGLEIAINQNKDMIAQTKQLFEAWETEKAAAAKLAAADAKKLDEELQAAKTALGKLELEHDAAWVKIREMREDRSSLQKDWDRTREAAIIAKQQYDEAVRESSKLERQLDNLADTGTCPTCGQPVAKKLSAKHQKEVEKELTEWTKLADPNELRRRRLEQETAYEKLAVFLETLKKAEAATDDTQLKINALRPTVSQLEAQLTQRQDARNRAETERNPHGEPLQKLNQQRRALNLEHQELKEDINKALRQLERVQFWVKGFKDVALYLIEEVLIELEAVTNTILGEVGLVGWKVKYAMERETKSGTVQRGITVTMHPPANVQASSIKWESWSGGEGQRLRIVGAVALSEVLLRHAGVQANLEIFDEPATYVSGAGVDELCAYLKQRAKSQGKTIFFIDHLIEESAVFAGTVTVTKTVKGSVIQEDY